jgi:hypothetical protein
MKTLGRLAALLLAFAAAPSFAAITCNVTVTSISTVYSPTVATDNVSTGSYTISCTRLATDANSLAWSLAANNGLQSGGAQKPGRGACRQPVSTTISTDRPAHTTNRWQGRRTRFTGTMQLRRQPVGERNRLVRPRGFRSQAVANRQEPTPTPSP